MSRRSVNQTRSILVGHLEHVSSKAFVHYHRQITQLVHRRHGIYALYRNGQLYYVGLAIDLRRRVRQHLRDRHSGRWDRFSVYLVRERAHLSELETLLNRIAAPTGNLRRGSLRRALDLRPDLGRLVRSQDRARLHALLGRMTHSGDDVPDDRWPIHRRRTLNPADPRPLHGLLSPNQRLESSYRGRRHVARVSRNGRILVNGKAFDTPSAAARAVTSRSVNGWTFWRYRSPDGAWRKIAELRN